MPKHDSDDDIRRLLQRPRPETDEERVRSILRRARRFAATKDLLHLAFVSTFHAATALLRIMMRSQKRVAPPAAAKREDEDEP